MLTELERLSFTLFLILAAKALCFFTGSNKCYRFLVPITFAPKQDTNKTEK
jgi:hypothetical protein